MSDSVCLSVFFLCFSLFLRTCVCVSDYLLVYVSVF